MTDIAAAEDENRTYIPAKEVKLSVFYNLYISENGANTSIEPQQLDISSFNGIDYNCIKDAIRTNYSELLVKFNFPNIQIYYEGDGKPYAARIGTNSADSIDTDIDTKSSLKTLVDEKYEWSEEMEWGATEDKRLIVEITEFSGSEQTQIDSQIKKALSLWQTRKAKVHPTLYTAVERTLRHGKVPPIFHTLIHDHKNRLFPIIPKVPVSLSPDEKNFISLSAHTVKAGSAETSEIGTLPLRKDKSYLSAFFDNGSARTQVNDSMLQNPWIFDEEYTKTIAALVNTPAVMIGEDMEITKLVKVLDVDEDHGCNLITRR